LQSTNNDSNPSPRLEESLPLRARNSTIED
jgi:hypothetical protein